MGVIKLLPSLVIDQIAAGEVIENPAAIVRELIDNSLDAKAQNINVTVEIADDDLKIIIKDDGIGIAEDDLLQAFNRHATSKLKKFNDLQSLNTLGFRGEALAAIASVAVIEATSSTEQNGLGKIISLHAGKEQFIKNTHAVKGTTIQVSQLFYNVPVRKKFLKKISYEATKMKKEVIYKAFASEGVAFQYTLKKLSSSGELNVSEVITLNIKDTFRDKITEFYSNPITDNLIPLEVNMPNFILQGYVTNHRYKANTKQNQHFIVNQRRIVNKKLDYALNSAYLNILPHRNFPASFLKITVPANLLNVNIHPQKQDVNFVEEQAICSAVHRAIKKALTENFLHKLSPPMSPTITPPPAAIPTFDEEKVQSVLLNRQQDTSQQHQGANRSEVVNQILDFSDNIKQSVPKNSPPKTFDNHNHNLARLLPTSEQDNMIVNQKPSTALKILGQVSNSYIVYTVGSELLLCDQHAIHERINFDRVSEKYRQKKLGYQYLLLPMVITKDEVTIDELVEHQNALNELGIFFDRMDKKSIQIEKIPDYIHKSKEVDIINLMLDIFLKHHHADKNVLLEKMLSTIACRMSIMSGDSLSMNQMEELMRIFYDNKHAHTCPHGRELIKTFALNDMHKFFDRACERHS